MRNRWYDAQTGRFLTQDPLGRAGGVNLYAYAGNNPIAFSDPYGLDPCKQQATSGSWLCQGIAAGKAQLAAIGVGIASTVNTVLDYTTGIVDATRLLFQRNEDGSKLTGGDAALAAVGVGLSAVPGGGKGITISEKAFAHVLERHGAQSVVRNASKFAAGEDIMALIKAAEGVGASPAKRGAFQRVVDAGREIGVDRSTGKGTSIYTVIHDTDGNLITAHPGQP